MAAASSVHSTFASASKMARMSLVAAMVDESPRVVKRKADRIYFHIPSGPFKTVQEYHKEKEAAIGKGSRAVDDFLLKAYGDTPITASIPQLGGSKDFLELMGFDSTTKMPLKDWLNCGAAETHTLQCDEAFQDSFSHYNITTRKAPSVVEYNSSVLGIIRSAMSFGEGGYVYTSQSADANLVSLFELQYKPGTTMKQVRAESKAKSKNGWYEGPKVISCLLPGPLVISLPIGILANYINFYANFPFDIGYPGFIKECGPPEEIPHYFQQCQLEWRRGTTGISLGLEPLTPCSPPTPVSSDPIPNVVEEYEPSRAELAALAEAALLAEVEAEEAAARAPKPSKKKKSKASAPAPIVGGGAASPSVPMNVVEVYEPPAPAPAPVVPAPAPAPYVNYNVVEVYEPPPPVVNYNVVEVLYEDEDPTNV